MADMAKYQPVKINLLVHFLSSIPEKKVASKPLDFLINLSAK